MNTIIPNTPLDLTIEPLNSVVKFKYPRTSYILDTTYVSSTKIRNKFKLIIKIKQKLP